MSIIEHLEALRRVLMVSLIASGRILGLLVHQAGLKEAVFLQPTGGVLLTLKVAMYMGVVIAAPVIIQQTWWFVSPGLHPHERRFILPMIVATVFFFLLGVAVAIFALPLYLKVLSSLSPPNTVYLPDIG